MSNCGCASGPCSCDLLASLQPGVECALAVRDSIGAVLHKIYIVTRIWKGGKKPGEGIPSDTVAQIKPSPGIKDYSHDLRIREGGSVKQGDIILTGISKGSYPKENQIDCSTESKNIEKFYLINDRLYTVINVKEDYLTWDVQVRKYSSNKRYGEK